MEEAQITKADIQEIVNGLSRMEFTQGYISHYDGIPFKEYMKDCINVLHTSKRQDRYDELQAEFKKHNISKVLYWEGEIFKHTPKKGICRGHKRIVQFAKDQELPYIIIAENDIRLFGKGAWQYFIDNIPHDYDTYSGLVYVGDIQNNRITSQASGMTSLYIVHERFYDLFLSIPDDVHIDREISKYCDQYKLMVSPMFVVEQSGSFSDNVKKKCDYSPLLKGRSIFNG